MSKTIEKQLEMAVKAGINLAERISELKELEKAQDFLIESLKDQNKELKIENKSLKDLVESLKKKGRRNGV